MTVQNALDKVHEEYGLYNQLEVVEANELGVIFAPKEDSLYDSRDIDFLEEKYMEYIKEDDPERRPYEYK